MRILVQGITRHVVRNRARVVRDRAERIAGQPTPHAATAPRTLTGKERLGRKWMDEQRIDNCNVPIDMRGTRPRPSVCPHAPTS